MIPVSSADVPFWDCRRYSCLSSRRRLLDFCAGSTEGFGAMQIHPENIPRPPSRRLTVRYVVAFSAVGQLRFNPSGKFPPKGGREPV